ncbi:protein uxt-like [Lichtheimia corymbifera JMRC:FSU:9682]|uniref:Protein uxt-like n=1 Tax=Lichtheimia corymbifera JMRC:FSU:9682 TaxID=1263082 RepID=A0A068RPJ9_9FUNG|nr:protein uxt-like [Lichtheimia corymbifera JMRC:FSU:9682]
MQDTSFSNTDTFMARDNVATLLSKYDEFINLKLKPNLKTVLDSRDTIYSTISEYQKLKAQIQTIQDCNLKEMKTMTDIGNQFYVQAHIPDTQYIFVNVGFGLHVQFTLEEAMVFIDKNVERLDKIADKRSAEADKIRAHIKLTLEAMNEVLQNR